MLFELIAARYERRSMLITANQPFGEWGKIFPDQAMTLAAIDRLVHHATILEMNVESYRRREALDRKRGRGRPAIHATIKKTEKAVSPRLTRRNAASAPSRPVDFLVKLGVPGRWRSRVKDGGGCRAVRPQPRP